MTFPEAADLGAGSTGPPRDGGDSNETFDALAPAASDLYDWPPASYAENDHVLVWWLPEYDDLLRQLVDEYQWAWQSVLLRRLEELIPEAVLQGWRNTDPQCQEYSWYNVLGVFGAARAKQLGLAPRAPRDVECRVLRP